ncbi:interleukin-17F-like [Poeciliopsis prolifica]|uniref:interleukin-17F-like n=1 Tax=Poeciliopsis prolifica TaxID=188132 RepID=UPI00241452C9|nr:interleukin-17F-like [Poeciliopsis prolifica]XP_054881114.1 interleukin-17F-like [Poeciliopsis prolifica]
MFPAANGSRVTVVGAVVMVMMLMMAEVESKHPRKRSDGSAEQTVSLRLDPDLLQPIRIPRPLHNASISPWTYNTSHDESLFPPTLSEARCLLKGCLDLEGKEDQNLQSRPIWYQVMVLKRVRTEGAEHSYHYRLETRNVPVGCTCVRHMVHVQE